MKHAFGYIRVSTEGQATDGLSLETQKAKIEAWCLIADVNLLDCFVDAGISGSRVDNRPELARALEAVTNKRGILVVYSLSRLARSTKDTILISERLDNFGCDLVSLSEKIDTTSAAGRMVFRILAVLAEFERDLVSERTTEALAHKRSLNQRIGNVPFGWDLAPDGKSLLLNPDEQASLTMMREQHRNGKSLREIAAHLERAEIKTKTGKTRWSAKVVRGVLHR